MDSYFSFEGSKSVDAADIYDIDSCISHKEMAVGLYPVPEKYAISYKKNLFLFAFFS